MMSVRRSIVSSVSMMVCIMPNLVESQGYPMAYPDDTDWVFRPDLSDEFVSPAVNTEKWFAAGKDGECGKDIVSEQCVASAAVWHGRAPSLFVKDNISLRNQKLNLIVKYEPNNKKHFPHNYKNGSPIIDYDCNCKYQKYTTAGVASKNGFLYGYVEARARIADASFSSAFWLIGNCHEIDVFETIGNKISKNKVSSCLHYDYKQDGFCKNTKVADDFDPTTQFHVYAVEWDPDFVKIYLNGKILHEMTRIDALARSQWPPASVMKNKNCVQHIWVDNETFAWKGYPVPKNFPRPFTIDYIRVWQRASLCVDDAEWYYQGEKNKTCTGWVAQNKRRCSLFSKGYVTDRCPLTCGLCTSVRTDARTKSPDPPYDVHRNKGYCRSDNELVNTNIILLVDCWNFCSARNYPFADWFQKKCFCQKTCDCMSDTRIENRKTLVPKKFKLPRNCCRNKNMAYEGNKKKNCLWAKRKKYCGKSYKSKSIKKYWCQLDCGTCKL